MENKISERFVLTNGERFKDENNLLFLHTKPLSEALVKKLEAVI